MRIVTLLPSATEIVCALGLQDRLVGVSHSCDFPPGVDKLPVMTSTSVPHAAPSDRIDGSVREHLADNAPLYTLDIDALESAAPDFIVSQALCDVCAVSTGDVLAAIDALPSKPVLIDLEPNTLDEVFDDCLRVGEMLGRGPLAREWVDGLRSRRAAVADRTAAISSAARPRVAFLEWLMPPFSGGHWNPELVELAGGINLLGKRGKPSESLTWTDVIASSPEVIFVACCGFSRERSLADARTTLQQHGCRRMPAVQSGNVFVADGNAYFSRPGPRLIDSLEMMAHALHPQIHPASQHAPGASLRLTA